MGSRCARCDTVHESGRFFCPTCGYDLVTGSITQNSAATADATAGVKESSINGVSQNGSGSSSQALLEGDSVGSDTTSRLVYKPPSTSPVKVSVDYDRDFYNRVVQGGEMNFPIAPAEPTVLELLGDEIHIGRVDESRDIFPDVDLSELTQDIAVSIQHCMVRVSANGVLTLTDLGSTNGTFLGSMYSRSLKPHTPTEISSGSLIFLGAWTRLQIST